MREFEPNEPKPSLLLPPRLKTPRIWFLTASDSVSVYDRGIRAKLKSRIKYCVGFTVFAAVIGLLSGNVYLLSISAALTVAGLGLFGLIKTGARSLHVSDTVRFEREQQTTSYVLDEVRSFRSTVSEHGGIVSMINIGEEVVLFERLHPEDAADLQLFLSEFLAS